MATLEISDELLKILKHEAGDAGLTTSELAESILLKYFRSELIEAENDFGLPTQELKASAARSELEEASGISVSEEEIDAGVAELLATYRKGQKRASA